MQLRLRLYLYLYIQSRSKVPTMERVSRLGSAGLQLICRRRTQLKHSLCLEDCSAPSCQTSFRDPEHPTANGQCHPTPPHPTLSEQGPPQTAGPTPLRPSAGPTLAAFSALGPAKRLGLRHRGCEGPPVTGGWSSGFRWSTPPEEGRPRGGSKGKVTLDEDPLGNQSCLW